MWNLSKMTNPFGNSVLNYLKAAYVFSVFCAALCLGALKGLLVGPVASLLLITGNVSVILGLFPAHVTWTVHTIVKTPQLDTVLRALLLVILPIVAVLWLAISIVGSLLVAVGYGFFAPWVSTFEAFRHRSESSKFIHCITDGTWSTIKGSCTVVRDFLDLSYHTYPSCLKDIRQKCSSASRPYDINSSVQRSTCGNHAYQVLAVSQFCDSTLPPGNIEGIVFVNSCTYVLSSQGRDTYG